MSKIFIDSPAVYKPHIYKRLVLIGFRGAGKTTIAKALAQAFRWQYISTDELIAKALNMGIAQFVQQSGWKPFRAKETEIINQLKEIIETVIDCGGGVIESSKNMLYLMNHSLVIWVDAELQDLYTRLQKDGDRPLLSQSDMQKDIAVNYKRREEKYRQYCHIYINTSHQKPDDIMKDVLDYWQNHQMLAKKHIDFRTATKNDIDFLWEMLYECLYLPEGEKPFPKEIIQHPDIAKYLQDWGRSGDLGFIAIDALTGKPVGAAWLRLFSKQNKAYGFVDEHTPELSIAILAKYRAKGIGSLLLKQIIARARKQYQAISLSVDSQNPAFRLYQKLGFKVVKKCEESLTMRKSLFKR